MSDDERPGFSDAAQSRVGGFREESPDWLAHETLGMRIRAGRKARELAQWQVAEKVGTTQPTVNRWEKDRNPPDDTMIARLAGLFGVPPAQLRYGIRQGPRQVPVVGYVGAGAEVYPIDDHPQGHGLDEVDAPPSPGDRPLVALRVRGDSMYPMKDGWLIFYTRDHDGVPDECHGQLCVVKVANDGPTLIKEVRRGSAAGLYTLMSWNAPPIEDARVDWAARVVDIRPA